MKKTDLDPDPWAVGWATRALVLVAFLAAMTVPLGFVPIVAVATRDDGEPVAGSGRIEIPLIPPTSTPTPVVEPGEPHTPRIGIVAGHSGIENDSGAVCDSDGLQEVSINSDVAQRVVTALQARGWEVDLFQEFDVRLNGYRADAILSIHSDSCTDPPRSGFKVARAEVSYIPEPEDRLLQCVIVHYMEHTGLPFDAHTITPDMTRYHAYYEIDPATPAAIIEIGFMSGDRELLTQRPDVVAQGIVDGLICFIDGEQP